LSLFRFRPLNDVTFIKQSTVSKWSGETWYNCKAWRFRRLCYMYG
jgi:hypothetical protein